MSGLIATAKTHGFRPPHDSEPENTFRIALAKHVLNGDRIEAFEILFGVGWDEWDDDQNRQLLSGMIDMVVK